MSTQTEALTPPASTETRSPLYRGIAITGGAAIPIASVFSLLFVLNRTVGAFVLSIVSAAGMGLLLGWISRLALPRRSSWIHWLVSLFGLSIGMTFLGWLTRGSLGMDLIERSNLEPYWEGLIRLIFSAANAWLPIRAWARKPTPSPIPARQEQARVRKTAPVVDKPKTRKARRRRPKIRLAKQVEHRCPYCLEIVEPNDPRGSKECPICHAVHHADCWAVTGMCQVPHHNT